MNYLTREDEEAVRNAVRRAESGTSGEIVPMLVPASDDYREGACKAATLIAAALALCLGLVLRDTSVWFFLPVALLLHFPVLALVRPHPNIKLAFVAAREVLRTVQRSAISAFHEKGLHRTREENGILIFISLAEHRVWILGDRGIDRVIPPERWISFATRLTSGIRAGTLGSSLVEVIGEIGEVLKEHFPARSDDTNELPDLIPEKES